jgi:2-oxoglutarate dehydrogenase E2 component (dihydrolipoamide succinyltransferase)
MDNSSTVANFTVAVRSYRQGEDTRWVKVAVWGKSAVYCADHLRKGDAVYVSGRVEAPEVYTDRNGQMRVAEKFTADTIENWQPRQQEGAAPAAPAPAAAAAPAPAPAPVRQAQPAAAQHPAYAAAGHQPQSAPAPAPAQGGFDDDPPF